jgi:hypothetical protein
MCIGRYECRYVRHDIESENDELVATTTYSGPVADLLPQPQPVELRPHGGGRFLSRQPWEDGTTVWDFAADSLFTDRLLKRA